jgi:hypothetical protein
MSRISILRTIDDEALFKQLHALVNKMPHFKVLDDDSRRWLGRLSALVQETGSISDQVALSSNATRLEKPLLREGSVAEIKNILFRALAFAELGAPSAVQGAFIAAGNQFDAFSAVSKILGEAKRTVLFVDPYMDATALTDFAVLAPEGILVRLLADEAAIKASLEPAIPRWLKQQGGARPLEVRVAAARSLHDRSIQIDQTAAWIATQSFKDLAARSPASLSLLDGEAGKMKIEAYETIWESSKPVR